MPETIEINNLYIDDSALSNEDHKLYLFADICENAGGKDIITFKDTPYPYILSKELVCKNVRTASGGPIGVSKNKGLFRDVRIVKQA